MAKIITDDGDTAASSKPVRLPSFPPHSLPDPKACAGSIIIVNDPRTPNKLRLAMSNGSSWDQYARIDEVTAAAAGSVFEESAANAEIRKRLAALSGLEGADIPTMSLAAVMRHLINPTRQTRHVLQSALATLASANKLADSPITTATNDQHFTLPDAPTTADSGIEELRQRVGAVEMDLNGLIQDFHSHDHTPVLKDGTPVSWDDFQLKPRGE